MKVKTAVVLGSVGCIAYGGIQTFRNVKKSFYAAEFSYEVQYRSPEEAAEAREAQEFAKLEKLVHKLFTMRDSYSAFCEAENCLVEVHASSAEKFQEAMLHHIKHNHEEGFF